VSAALDDLVVLDLTIARAGPTAVRYLADWGARVLRIEQRGDGGAILGDHNSSDYINLHRSKQLIGLDLTDDVDKRRFFRLVEHADVIVENNRAPVKAKLGIDYDACAAVNPRIIYGSIAGYGQDGPASSKGAVDQIIQGVGGLMSITGLPGQGPVRAGIAVSDSAAGHQLAIGILLALRERERTGRGQWVKVSLLEAMISFLDFQAVRWTIDGHVPPQEGNHHPTGRPMGTYRAADGYLNDYYSFLGDVSQMVADSAAKDAETVRAYAQGFEAAGCDELILFPSDPDPVQVDLLADAVFQAA